MVEWKVHSPRNEVRQWTLSAAHVNLLQALLDSLRRSMHVAHFMTDGPLYSSSTQYTNIAFTLATDQFACMPVPVAAAVGFLAAEA